MDFKILSHIYKVSLDNKLYVMHGVSGRINTSGTEIILDETLCGSRRDETFMHEVIEALNYHQQFDLPHHTITALSECLMQVLKDNNLWRAPQYKD